VQQCDFSVCCRDLDTRQGAVGARQDRVGPRQISGQPTSFQRVASARNSTALVMSCGRPSRAVPVSPHRIRHGALRPVPGETGAVVRVGFVSHNGRSSEIAARTGVDAPLPPASWPLPTGARAMAHPDDAPPRVALVPLLPMPDATTHPIGSVKRIPVGYQWIGLHTTPLFRGRQGRATEKTPY